MEASRRSERLKMKRDRLSDLPNAILLHIMSFLMIRDVVKTTVLSKRWKNLWKSLLDLKLNAADFKNPWFFSEYVSNIVSSRRGNYPLRTLDFKVSNQENWFQPHIFTDLISHVVTHGVQQLNIVVPWNVNMLPCLFSCHSLTSLYIHAYTHTTCRLPRHLDLPALRSLHLKNVAITADCNGCAEPFSTCHKLNNMYIDNCHLYDPTSTLPFKVEGVINITNATLISLTIIHIDHSHSSSYLFRSKYKYVISTPRLYSFVVNGSPFRPQTIPEWMVKIDLQSSSLT